MLLPAGRAIPQRRVRFAPSGSRKHAALVGVTHFQFFWWLYIQYMLRIRSTYSTINNRDYAYGDAFFPSARARKQNYCTEESLVPTLTASACDYYTAAMSHAPASSAHDSSKIRQAVGGHPASVRRGTCMLAARGWKSGAVVQRCLAVAEEFFKGCG